MSRHCTPASARARRIATAPMSMPDIPSKRPNGCSPTPMIATSSISASRLSACDGAKREGHDLGAVVLGAERHDDQLHLGPGHELLRVVGGEPGLDLELARQLDVADAVGDEGLAGGPRVRRRRRRKALDSPGP